jgi:hypothetical protein
MQYFTVVLACFYIDFGKQKFNLNSIMEIKMDRKTLLENRKQLFDEIISSLSRDVGKLDKYFEQDKYYIKPESDSLVLDVANGELVFEVKGEYFNTSFSYLISIWQVGTRLKIGILLKDESLFKAFVLDDHSGFLDCWGKDSHPEVSITHGGAFYDWQFNAESLYSSYMNQENYIMGIRHMHLKALKILYDYLSEEHISNSY